MSHVIGRIGARVAEFHPYIWRLAWTVVRRVPPLLPHDKSYNALRHFIALKPNSFFLDVGANDGISALSFRRFDRKYRILSLEPNRMLEPWLQQIKATDTQFDYMMVGAASEPSRLKFYVPVYHGIVLHTFTSSSLERTRVSLAQSFGDSVAAAADIRQVEGQAVRIDDLKIDPAIIKIDAEGSDYEVLLGATKTIGRSRPFVMVESDPGRSEELSGYFQQKNYRVLDYDIESDRFYAPSEMRYLDRSGHRNTFAIPEEMLAPLSQIRRLDTP